MLGSFTQMTCNVNFVFEGLLREKESSRSLKELNKSNIGKKGKK